MIRTRRRRLVCGVGVNDSLTPMSEIRNGKQVICPIYKKWHDMIVRCYDERRKQTCPSYHGCVVDHGWLAFSRFREWVNSKNWQGMEIDKDLIGCGKLYSPATCVFITRKLNTFLAYKKPSENGLPPGVCMRHGNVLFRSQITRQGKQFHLGVFDTAEGAYRMWASEKAKMAIQLASEQESSLIASGLLRWSDLILKECEEWCMKNETKRLLKSL